MFRHQQALIAQPPRPTSSLISDPIQRQIYQLIAWLFYAIFSNISALLWRVYEYKSYFKKYQEKTINRLQSDARNQSDLNLSWAGTMQI